MSKRIFLFALPLFLIGSLLVLDYSLTEKERARILSEYMSQEHTVPEEYKDALLQGAFQCERHYENFYTRHMTCWIPSGGHVFGHRTSAQLSLFGPGPLFFELIFGRIGKRNPDRPGGSPITGRILLGENNVSN
jgi:hypothetical protein